MENATYKIEEQLYAGDKHIIYKGIRENDKKSIVLKILKAPYPTVAQLNKLKGEFAIERRFDHANIAAALEIEQINNNLSLVREYVDGDTLAVFAKGKPIDAESFFRIAFQVLEALKALHQQRVIHRNICPSNLLIDKANGEIKLIGFSLAKEQSREAQYASAREAFEAELIYISPEQTGRMNSKLDHRSDIYSAGIVFYELLAGVAPFDAKDPLELIHQQIAVLPTPLTEVQEDIAPALGAVILKMLAKSADDRYQSVWGVMHDLKKCAEIYKSGNTKTTFVPGEMDRSDQFTVSEKLYGRDIELNQLLKAFRELAQGGGHMVLVNGYSGTGKSTLVNQVQKTIVQHKGFFISGKFDQFKRDVPLSSVLAAFRQLIRQLLTENQETVAMWKAKVLEAVGAAGQVIIEVLPEVGLLIGAQPPLPDLPPIETNNRFNQIFNSFVRVFCEPEHPLCIFLDDLQWIDSASRQWIENQMSDPSLNNFFLIGAYRDNEVTPSHPLMMMLDRLQQSGVKPQIINLQPLNLADLGQLVADTLHTTHEACSDLAEVIFRKTYGNPFFTRQCLLTLNESGAIYMDTDTRKWLYDMENVQQVKISDNVVELMEALIQRLPDNVQQVLKIAACVGNKFDARTLNLITAQHTDDTTTQLANAVQQGVIIPARGWAAEGSEEYSFLHDRIQQAALSMVGAEEKKNISLQIGRLLLSDSKNLEADEKIYDIADHLNDAISLITDSKELMQLVAANRVASNRAKNAAAYEPAHRYITKAMDAYDVAKGEKPAALSRDLYLLRADVEHMCGNNAAAETYYNEALGYADNIMEQARIQQRKIHYYTNLGRFEDAYKTGRDAVRPLGVNLPAKFVPPLLIKDVITYRILLGRRKIADIVDAEEMTDEKRKMAVLLMSTFARACYQIRPELCIAVCAKIVNLCLQYGNTEGGYIGFVAFGPIFLGAILKNKQAGFDFGQTTLALVEKYKSTFYRAESYFVVGYFAMPWRRPAAEMESYWQIAYDAGMASGDLFHTSCAICATIQSYYMRGKSFDEVMSSSDHYLEFLQRIDNNEGINTLLAVRKAISNLQGETASHTSYSSDGFDEEEYVKNLSTFGSRHFAHYYFINKMQTLYLWGEYEKAYGVSLQSDVYMKDSPGMLHTAEHYFYKALIICALYPTSKGAQRMKWKRKLNKIKSIFKGYAAGEPSNFIHKYQLIDAETSRVTGDSGKAENLYYAAIESSSKYGYQNIHALANELAAAFHYKSGRKNVVGVHLRDAEYAYKNWGATAYASFLSKKYPDIIELGREQAGGLQGGSKPVAFEEGMMDLTTVLKSSEAISREIRLPDLLSALMKILIENAGAQRMVLLLQKGKKLVVNTECIAGTEGLQSVGDVPVDEYKGIARSVANYVARTRQLVMLDDAAASGDFVNDAYIQESKPRSVLCAPLLQQGNLTGLIYLENNLASSVFTKDRIDLIALLSGQMAISIENALLYNNLEEKVVERTEELKKTNVELSITLDNLKESQRRLIHAEKMASLGQMASGIAHEIQNPLNFVINFAGASEDMLSELKELIVENREKNAPEITADIDGIIDDLKMNAEKINSHGQRAGNIVKNLITQTSGVTEVPKQVNLGKLLEQSIERARNNFALSAPGFAATFKIENPGAVENIECMPGNMQTVLADLIDNALYTVREKKNRLKDGFEPEILITASPVNEKLQITVRDNGEGIAPEIMNKIFIPFFTTKPTGKGNTGNGLSRCHQIIADVHHGQIEVLSDPGQYSEIKLLIPQNIVSNN